MALDLKRLHRDAKRLQEQKLKSRAGRETTGTTKAVRAALAEIYQLREEGVQWSDIAKALADQGVVQGKAHSPLTTNRLTALVRQIEKQRQAAQAKSAKKSAIAASSPINALQNQRLVMSSELEANKLTTDIRPSSQSEDELNRLAFEKVRRMTKE
jgi:hypothetical protein